MARGKLDHKARFDKWQYLVPEKTRHLSSAVEGQLVPMFEAAGFVRVENVLRQIDCPVSGREVELERWADDWVDSVQFNFDKGGAPRFQVHLSRRMAAPPHAWIWSGNLVARQFQYLHFWGKPWWVPISLWSEMASLRAVAKVESCVGEALEFLATGNRGSNVSRQVT